MPYLQINLTKRPDGGYVIACTRADGSVTWQRGRDAGFFPLHDITHYAVETELRHRRGFFGLLAEGWEFTDFSSDWPRGRIPADAEPAELIVGLLDSERHGVGAAVSSDPDVRGGERVMTAAEFNAAAARFFEQLGCAEIPPAQSVNLTDEELDRIRRRRDALLADWDALPLGGTLALTFNVQ